MKTSCSKRSLLEGPGLYSLGGRMDFTRPTVVTHLKNCHSSFLVAVTKYLMEWLEKGHLLWLIAKDMVSHGGTGWTMEACGRWSHFISTQKGEREINTGVSLFFFFFAFFIHSWTSAHGIFLPTFKVDFSHQFNCFWNTVIDMSQSVFSRWYPILLVV